MYRQGKANAVLWSFKNLVVSANFSSSSPRNCARQMTGGRQLMYTEDFKLETEKHVKLKLLLAPKKVQIAFC